MKGSLSAALKLAPRPRVALLAGAPSEPTTPAPRVAPTFARRVQNAMVAQQEERVAEAPPINFVIPPQLLPYQHQPATILATAVRRHHGALDASDTGTGKTYTACAVAKMLGFKIAIVCPKAVIPAWQRVAEEFHLEVVFALNYEKLRNGKTRWCRGKEQSWVPHPSGGQGRGHYSQVEKFKWMLDQTTLLVIDEAHRCKGSSSLNAELMIAAALGNIHTLALSATAASNPTEMKALGVLLRLFTRGEFWNWCKRYGCVQGQFGGQQFNGDQRVLLGLHRQIFPARGARVRISELGDAFPERQITAEAYDLGSLTADVKRAYEEMEDALLMLDERTSGYAVNALSIMMKARQRSELLKVPMMTDMVEDLIDEGNSVALFVNFTETVSHLMERLQGKVPGGISTVVGGQHENARQGHIDAFQRDDHRVIIANIRAGGIGISLHDLNGRYARVGLVCPTFSAIDLVQVLGRLHRQGARSKAIYRILYAARTVEEAACRSVRGKLTNLAALNDGDLRAGIQLNFRQ